MKFIKVHRAEKIDLVFFPYRPNYTSYLNLFKNSFYSSLNINFYLFLQHTLEKLCKAAQTFLLYSC